jgi:hypothetical protein
MASVSTTEATMVVAMRRTENYFIVGVGVGLL